MDDYYAILGVSRRATKEEIQKRYRFLVKAYHPDRFPSQEDKDLADEQLKQVNIAFAILSNPEKRAKYDQNFNSAAQPSGNKKSGSQSQGSQAKNPADDSKWNYMMGLVEKWGKDIASTKPFEEKEELVRPIHASMVHILDQAGISGAEEPFASIASAFANDIARLLVISYAVGAEEEYQGLPAAYPKTGLVSAATKQINEFITVINMQSVALGTLTIDDAKKLEKDFAVLLNNLVVSCQRSGAVVALRKKDTEKSAQAAAQGGRPPAGAIPPYRNQASTAPREPSYQVPQAPMPGPAKDHHPGTCAACGRFTEVRELEFSRNIGALVVRFYKTVRGNLCADCVEKYFWQFTVINLFFGWWGLRSFFYTIGYIIINIINYFKAWNLRNYSKNLSSIALESKFVAFAFFFVLGGIFYFGVLAGTLQIFAYHDSQNYSNAAPPISAPTKRPTVSAQQSSNTKKVRITATARPACKQWSEISVADVGQDECVTGIVQNAYFGGNIYFMTFSTEINAFRLIDMTEYPPNRLGKCLVARGVVKAYDKIPYIEVDDNVSECK
jgi:hypothetical protein